MYIRLETLNLSITDSSEGLKPSVLKARDQGVGLVFGELPTPFEMYLSTGFRRDPQQGPL